MRLRLNTDLFLYDITSLLRAFYPGEQLVIEKEQQRQVENGAVEHDLFLSVELSETIQVVLKAADETVYEAKQVFTGKEEPYWNPLRDGLTEVHKSSLRNEERRAYKNLMKRMIFEGFYQYTGKYPAWGTLTGVRPTKLAMEGYIAGESREKIRQLFLQDYLCSEKKAKLAAEIAETEYELLKRIRWQEGYSLYIGIPFCPTTCHYCSFASYSLEKFSDRVGDYLKALYREIDAMAEFLKDQRLSCVYFGGGTPTSLSEEQLDDLLGYVRTVFPMEAVEEFTVEAGRPDTITQGKLAVMKKHQVSRISINPQTMKQETLERIGRNHSVEDIRRVFALARQEGFDNINMDLIVGLPGETVEDVKNTMEQIRQIKPDSLTVHSMVLKRAAKLNQEMTAKEGCSAEDVDRMVELGMQCAADMGMKPYYMYRQKNAQGSLNESRDNIGYAVPGKEGLYNIIIMEEKQTIVALGAGATTKRVGQEDGRIDRADNVKSLKDYMERTDEMIERKKRLLEDFQWSLRKN